jgi:hypothetical protein
LTDFPFSCLQKIREPQKKKEKKKKKKKFDHSISLREKEINQRTKMTWKYLSWSIFAICAFEVTVWFAPVLSTSSAVTVSAVNATARWRTTS